MKTTEIIQNVLKILNIDPTSLAREIGASDSRINDILKGRTRHITSKTAAAICDRFPLISYDYLLFGTGSPYADGRHYTPDSEPQLSPAEVLRTLLLVYQTNTCTLSRLTGISRGNLSNIMSGNNRPHNISKMNAERITRIYPSVRTEWLVTGKGPMFTNGEKAPTLPVKGTNAITDLEEVGVQTTDVPAPDTANDDNTAMSQPDTSAPVNITREEVAAMITEATAALEARNQEKFDKIISLLQSRTGYAAEE